MHLASQRRPSDKMHQASATPRSSSGSQKPQRVIPKDPGLNEAGGAEERGAEAREGGGHGGGGDGDCRAGHQY